jgi:hypothetical protein
MPDLTHVQQYYPAQVPGVDADPILLDFLRREFFEVFKGLRGVHQLPVLHEAPPKPREGRVAYADGTNWNPGSGAGVYVYNGMSWVKL